MGTGGTEREHISHLLKSHGGWRQDSEPPLRREERGLGGHLAREQSRGARCALLPGGGSGPVLPPDRGPRSLQIPPRSPSQP